MTPEKPACFTFCSPSGHLGDGSDPAHFNDACPPIQKQCCMYATIIPARQPENPCFQGFAIWHDSCSKNRELKKLSAITASAHKGI
jgi:hypothetical protein